MLNETSLGVVQSSHVVTPNQMRVPSVDTPAYCRSVLPVVFIVSRGEATCSSKALTNETSSLGKVPVQVGPAPKVPVQTSVPVSGIEVEPVPAPPVTIVLGADMLEAARGVT